MNGVLRGEGLPIFQIPVILFIQQHTVNKRTCSAASATDVQYKDVRVKDKTVIDLAEIKAMPFMQAMVGGRLLSIFLFFFLLH